ncbi:MAG: hypothetical protein WC966_08810 [Bradymonadales bacterium]|jgi:hypothetical protein
MSEEKKKDCKCGCGEDCVCQEECEEKACGKHSRKFVVAVAAAVVGVVIATVLIRIIRK